LSPAGAKNNHGVGECNSEEVAHLIHIRDTDVARSQIATPKKRSALVVNCWHDSNKGDAAISIGVVNALKKNSVADLVRVASYIYYPEQAGLDYGFRHLRAAHPDVEFVQATLPAAARLGGPRSRPRVRTSCTRFVCRRFKRWVVLWFR